MPTVKLALLTRLWHAFTMSDISMASGVKGVAGMMMAQLSFR